MHNFRIGLPSLTDYEFVPNWAYPSLPKFAPSISCLRPEHSQCKSSSSFWLTCSLALEFLSTLPVIYIWIFVHPTGCVLPQLEAKNAMTEELVWGGQCLVKPSHPVLWLAERRVIGSDPGQQNIIADTSCQPKIIARELCHLKSTSRESRLPTCSGWGFPPAGLGWCVSMSIWRSQIFVPILVFCPPIPVFYELMSSSLMENYGEGI